jgi:hypothetical protein
VTEDDSSALVVAESVPIGLIRVDPSRNVSRGGRWLPPSHPRVRRLSRDVEIRGLLEPVGLRTLDRPVSRPCGGPCCSPEAMARDRGEVHLSAHLCEVYYGFERLSALIGLGRDSLRLLQPRPEATVSDVVTDEEAEEACLAENLVRSEPSDYEVALGLRALSLRDRYSSLRPHERYKSIAECFRLPSPYRVEMLVRIVERCPQDLLDEWDRESTDECRRALEQCARLDPELLRPESERHEAMRLLYAELRAREESSFGPSGRGGGKGRRLVRGRAEAALSALDRASERYDDASGGYVPLGPGEREAVGAVLRAVLSGAAEPVR